LNFYPAVEDDTLLVKTRPNQDPGTRCHGGADGFADCNVLAVARRRDRDVGGRDKGFFRGYGKWQCFRFLRGRSLQPYAPRRRRRSSRKGPPIRWFPDAMVDRWIQLVRQHMIQ